MLHLTHLSVNRFGDLVVSVRLHKCTHKSVFIFREEMFDTIWTVFPTADGFFQMFRIVVRLSHILKYTGRRGEGVL